jgi:uncharacterized damage-inducible protein DinB
MRPAVCIAVCTVLAAVPGGPAAQAVVDEPSGNPLSLSLRRVFDRAAANVLQVAALAPADLYEYRPVPEARSLGEQLAHTADVMYQLCAVAAGTSDPAKGSVEGSRRTKTEVLSALEEARHYCTVVYASMTDERALQVIVAGPRVPRAEVLVNAIAHIRQHCGNVRTYLRLNGIEPPAIEWLPKVRTPTA